MNRLMMIATTAVAAGLLLAAAQDKPKQASQQPGPEQARAMMEKWMKLAQPGEHHKFLDQLVGQWDLKIRMFWGGPQAPAMEATGTSKVRSILGGRFLLEEVRGDMPMPAMDGSTKKTTFEGLQLYGYDNYKKLYTTVWLDDTGTQIVTMTGTRVPGSSTIRLYGEMDEPMLDIHERMTKSVIRIEGPDRVVLEMYDLAVSDDYKVMEVVYTRKGSTAPQPSQRATTP